MRKAREPSERLWHETVSNLAEEERMVRGGLCCSCGENLQDMEDHQSPAL